MCQLGYPPSPSTIKRHHAKSIYGGVFQDEILATLSHVTGAVSMSNLGYRHSNYTHFFVVFNDYPHLDGKHTVFGKVTPESFEVLKDIENVKTNKKGVPSTPLTVYSSSVDIDPWEGLQLPTGCSIPEKPLISTDTQCSIC
eukprot:GHVR01029071.1.p1 GENE.GHVR01029071.1~~GHVR01029071.1.p1  ORF type:complete len:141 (-),score=32.12 GHVR01029071.1:282-704(-)